MNEVRAGAEAPPVSVGRKRGFARLAWLLLAVLVALVVVIGLSRAAPKPPRAGFDERPLKKLRSARPELVLIGNSMVESRFDERLLKRLIEPRRVSVLALPGSESAVWFARLKHSVLASKVKVKRVLVFFRHRELTLPALRTTGNYRLNVERSFRAPDPLIERKIRRLSHGPLGKLAARLEWLAPIDRLRKVGSAFVDAAALAVSSAAVSVHERARRHHLINDVFAVGALRDQPEEVTPDLEEQRFSAQLPGSFLPDMIELAKARGVELVFVRVRTRKAALGLAEKPELVEYTGELRTYLKRQGVGYRDLARDAWESVAMYGRGDHTAASQRSRYTRLFVEHHRELLEVP